MKRFLAALLAVILTISLVPTALAYSGPAVSSNIDGHFYVNVQRWTDPIQSTLAAEDGGYLRAECIGSDLVVERYDENLNYLSGQTIPLELPIFGGVYICNDYNFVVVGQTNIEEDDAKEVFRIIRYTKDWQKIDHASIYGANTTIPFDAGCLRFDRSDNMLYIRTCHEMYTSEDGLNHQANVMIAVRISDMTVTDSLTEVRNSNYGYVSHSFNQFVRVDGDTLLAVDHGDFYPRSVCLFKYPHSASSEKFYGRTTMVNALPIVNSTYHYNDTGVSVGGFEFSATDYLIAGCAYDMSVEADLMEVHRNIFVTATPKDNFTDEGTVIHWLTNYTADDAVKVSPPHLLKISDDRFFLTWTENGVLKYCFLDGKGQLDGTIHTGEGALSDCEPILDGSRIIWYVTDYSAPVFYQVNLNSPELNPDVLASGQAGSDITWVLYKSGLLELTGSGAMPDYAYAKTPWYAHRDSILNISVGEGITALGGNAFSACKNATEVSLPDSLERIGNSAFYTCEKLEKVTIPAGVTELGNNAFASCFRLSGVTLPNSLRTIGIGAFYKCAALTAVTVPEGVTGLGREAFAECSALETISLPATLTVIEERAFELCRSLTAITVAPGSSSFSHDSQGALYDRNKTTLLVVPGGFRGTFVIPDSVTTVGDLAAEYCSGMTGLRIPDSVTSIGSYAFSNCSLADVTVPESITVIPEGCFFYNEELASISIPETVTEIHGSALGYCEALTEIDLPDGLTVLGNAAFWGCWQLKSIVIPEGITELDHAIFYDCTSLETVKLPSKLRSIDYWCFQDCSSLQDLVLPDTLQSIGANAFENCHSLKSIVFPASVNYLAAFSFRNSGLTEITFLGDAPTFNLGMGTEEYAFGGVTATAYYPMYNSTWTEDVLQNYSGNLTWIPKDLHTHNWTDATCTAPQTCTICGSTQGEALGHLAVTDPGYAATCTKPGLTDGSHCGRCGETITQAQVIPALGHDYESVVTEPTCTEDGFTTHTCSRCGSSYVDNPTDATGHSFRSWHTTQEPTCTDPGQEQRECVYCDLVERKEIPATGHHYTFVTTPPTCTEQGYITMVCTGCSDSYIDKYTPATGHSWDEGVVIQEPTAVADGIVRYTCTSCGITEDRVMGHEHTYTTVITAPTCTEQGYTTYTCSCGHSEIGDYVAALGHQEVIDPGYPASCTEPGLTDGAHCGRCDVVLRDHAPISATGHHYEALVTPPTCDEPGCTTHTCSGCGDSYADSHVDALGHDWKGLGCTRCDAARENPFADTDPTRFYFDPVLWALEQGITKGTSSTEFSPDASCTRGQVVTFLWRAAGSPEPGSLDHPFTDVNEKAFYYKAMLWAVENGITSGMSAATFNPDSVCTRGQVVTFLWRAKGKPAAASASHPFTDVSRGAFYYDAMLWAVENHITSGMSTTTFNPGNPCTRGQVVTFLYRAFAE